MNHTTCTTRNPARESFTWEKLLEAKRLIDEIKRTSPLADIDSVMPSEFMPPDFYAVSDFYDARNTAIPEYRKAFVIEMDDYNKPIPCRYGFTTYEKKKVIFAHPQLIEKMKEGIAESSLRQS